MAMSAEPSAELTPQQITGPDISSAILSVVNRSLLSPAGMSLLVMSVVLHTGTL